MKAPGWSFLRMAGTVFLIIAAFHVAGYAFGWTKFRREEDVPAMIVGAISGGLAAAFVARRKKRAEPGLMER